MAKEYSPWYETWNKYIGKVEVTSVDIGGGPTFCQKRSGKKRGGVVNATEESQTSSSASQTTE